MKITSVKEIRKEDLVDLDALIKEFQQYLMAYLGYDPEDAELASADLEDPYMAPYVMQDSAGRLNLAGKSYEVCFCRTELGMCMMYLPDDIPPFEFYMLFDESKIGSGTVNEYRAALTAFVL